MGKLISLINSQLRGKVGAINFRVSGGQNIASAWTDKVANPKTPLQQYVRARQTLVMDWYRINSGVLKAGFRNAIAKWSPYNYFMNQNNPSATTGTTAETVELVYADIKASKGSMGQTAIASVAVSAGANEAVVTWNPADEPVGSAPTDRVTVLIFNETKGNSVQAVSNIARSVGTLSSPIPEGWAAADVIHSYVFFRSIVTTAVSDSVYLLGAVAA